MYCHVYEALFDTVYTIVGEYWLGGSVNSNEGESNHETPHFTNYHWPTVYRYYSAIEWNIDPYSNECTSDNLDGPWYNLTHHYGWGPFGVILDEQEYCVELPSADTARGIAKPTAYYPAGSFQTISAIANKCYRFSHWSDGVTDNPRTLFVTQDTTITAYFDTVSNIFDVAVQSNDGNLGYAELIEPRNDPPGTLIPGGQDPYYLIVGDDTSYCEMSAAIFRAKAYPEAYFWQWNDGVRENPRSVTVTQDTLLTAIFSREVPPPYYTPCPRVYKVVSLVEDIGRVRMVWPWSASVWPRSASELQVGWELALGLAGTPPDSCQIISCATTEKLLSDLELGVHYVAYVRTLCEDNGLMYYSDWSDSVEIYFPKDRFTVSAEANNTLRGRVYGGGEYGLGEVAVLTASANRHYSFLQWDDGVEDNPRFVEVTQDTSFTALFSDWEGIEAADSLGLSMLLLPNPASGSVVCVMGGDIFIGGVLTMTDATGREVMHKELPPQTSSHTIPLSGLAKGVYFVTLVTAQVSLTKKLLVE